MSEEFLIMLGLLALFLGGVLGLHLLQGLGPPTERDPNDHPAE